MIHLDEGVTKQFVDGGTMRRVFTETERERKSETRTSSE